MTTANVANSDGSISPAVYVNNSPLVVTGSTIVRPSNTTAYAFGQMVANSTTAAQVNPSVITVPRGIDVPFNITGGRLFKTGTSLTNALFRMHIYNQQITFAGGDGAAWSTSMEGYIGSLDVTVDKAFSDGAEGTAYVSIGSLRSCNPIAGTQNIFCVLEARNAYTPISGEVFTPVLEVQ